MKFKFVFFALFANIILFFIYPEMARASLINSFHFSIEVLKMLPPILILISLLDEWTSREQIETHLGNKSGAKGTFLSLLMGSASAGPLFSAFPIASSLEKKGVRTANIVIFLGSWATIKIPMLIMESGFLGMRFALLRFVITVPFILGIGYFVEKLVNRKIN